MAKRGLARRWIVFFAALMLIVQPAGFVSAGNRPAADGEEIQPPAALQVASGYPIVCVLKADGSIACWGSTSTAWVTVPAPNSGFTQVSTGAAHTCALRADGSITCWGEDSGNRLNIPSPNSGYTQVSAGEQFTCALRGDTSVACWGYNNDGQLNVPTPNEGFTQISTGSKDACGLRADGTIACWGRKYYGLSTPPHPNSGFIQVSAANNHTCALREDSSVTCWGDNKYNQLNLPGDNHDFVQISAKSMQTCGLREDGSITCWGDNYFGQLNPPVLDIQFSAVSVGLASVCALSLDGGVLCWGSNYSEQTPLLPVGPYTLPEGAYGAAYHQPLTAGGGTRLATDYYFDVIEGSLPPGLSLDHAGLLSGSATQAGAYTFTVRARDENAYIGTHQYTLRIAKITPSAAFGLLDRPVTYNGLPRAAAVSVDSSSTPGSPGDVRYGGSSYYPTQAGAYPVTADFIPHDRVNYEILDDLPVGAFVIEPAPLTVAANSLIRLQGEPNPPLTYTLSGFIPGEDALTSAITGAPQIFTPATQDSPPGVYPITVRAGSLAAANYTFAAFQDGALTVAARVERIYLPVVRNAP